MLKRHQEGSWAPKGSAEWDERTLDAKIKVSFTNARYRKNNPKLVNDNNKITNSIGKSGRNKTTNEKWNKITKETRSTTRRQVLHSVTERKWKLELAAAAKRDEELEVTPESADVEAKKIVLETHRAVFEKFVQLEYYVYVRTSFVLLPPQAPPPSAPPPLTSGAPRLP